MRATINNTLIPKIEITSKQYDIRDSKLNGFLIRVNPSGKMIYVCQYARGKRINIGQVGGLTPIQARDKANRKSADKNLAHLNRNFIEPFGNKPLTEITTILLEKWRIERSKQGIKASTINRSLAALKAVLSKAVEWNHIEASPIVKVKLAKLDSIPKVRYLSAQEEISLREALDIREQRIRSARGSGNLWRQERGYDVLPDLSTQAFADHLKPMVLISINTGIRRGELFNLKWEDVDLTHANLTVIGDIAKSRKTRHIPLNIEALSALKSWRQQTLHKSYVFIGKDGNKFTDIKKAWASLLAEAGIVKFRWHDLRHHFASRLVMAGVDLNTVRELLGHSDIKMTLRYAHLAPEHKANAVAKLCLL